MSSNQAETLKHSLTSRICLRRLGVAEYEPVWHDMQVFTDARDEHTPDELWLVQHPPVFTQGQAGKAEHVLAPGEIPVIQVDRGGQVTYHGPGQIVAYPLVDLRRKGIGVRQFVNRIEQSIIRVLAHYDVRGERIEGAPGIYVRGDKVASIGLRVRRGCTFHGLAFNIDMDLEPFQRINPCGYAGLQVTQLSQLAQVNFDEAEDRLLASFAEHLGYSELIESDQNQEPGIG
jgi:lipoyl(octanoyl) transferase